MLDLFVLVLLFFSITLHEVAHGYVAYRFGDQTAKLQGRLTLNPLKHVDPFGTILLPLLLFFSGAPLIGWAKPVPINPSYFQKPREQMMWCAVAGPLTNYTLALFCAILRKLLPLPQFLDYILVNTAYINLILGTFNLIPIPPLDGSRVVSNFLRGDLAYRYEKLEPYGILIVILLSYLGFLNFFLNLFRPFFKLFLQ